MIYIGVAHHASNIENTPRGALAAIDDAAQLVLIDDLPVVQDQGFTWVDLRNYP